MNFNIQRQSMKTEYVRFEWTVSLIIEKLIIPSYLCLKVFLPYISYYFRVYYRMTASHGQRDTEVDQVDEPARTETC